MINLDLEGNEVEIRRKGTKEIKKTIGKKKAHNSMEEEKVNSVRKIKK